MSGAEDSVVWNEARTAAFVAIEARMRKVGVGMPSVAAGAALVALNDLPVDQRMEAMGVTPMQAWDWAMKAMSKQNFVKVPTDD